MSFTKIDSNNITATGVTAGSYTNANITVNEAGQITSASNGVAGTGGGGGGSTGLQHTTYTYTGNGSTTTFSATSGLTVHTVLVIVDGVTQTPTTNYTISGSNIVFTSAPPASSDIQIRVLGDVASSGGGPKISSIAITDSNWDAIDDTAVDITGGYIKITGTGFVSGCLAYFNQTAAASISFVSSTELRISTGALAASTYVLYVINPDGGVAISVPGVTFSATPAWQTASSLSDQYDGVTITLSLVAQDATSYTLISGSLPPGLSLNSSTGAITGTVTGVTVDTTYTFTVRATDAQLQDSPRTFTVTITVSDPYFNRTTLLLSGSAISANTVIRDSSTNNFNLTVAGDVRASSFTPYGTGWSVYFDGTGDSLSISDNPVLDLGNSEFCIELWHYPTVFGAGWLFSKQTNYLSATGYLLRTQTTTGYIEFSAGSSGASWDIANIVTSQVPTLNAWNHIAVTRSSTDNRIRVFLNGALAGLTGVTTASIQDTSAQFTIGNDSGGSVGCTGYISNFRLVKGSIPAAYQTASTTVGISQIFVPPTQPLTVIANTSLLTCNANRFLDASTNNFAITRNGDARVVSFNPFGITNTGVNGSMYFDGTGDLLTVPTSSVFNLGTGDFTIEFWAYLDPYVAQSSSSYWAEIIGINVGASDSNSVIGTVGIWQSDGTGTSTVAGEYTVIISGSSTNQQRLHSGVSGYYKWTHVALTRSSGTFTLWQDGISKATASVTADINRNDYVKIGRSINSGIKGNVSNIRVIKGTAVYTSNFTPPTQPLTAIANTQLLTLQYRQPHNNHTFLDASSNQFVVTRNGNATQGTFSPFSQSGHSAYFDGTGDYLSIPTNTAFDLPGDFTIEFWVYLIPLSGNTNYHIVTRGSYQSGTQDWYIYCNSSYQPAFGFGNPATNINLPSILPNTWNHIAFSRSNTTLQGFVNGVKHTSTLTTSNNFTNTRPVSIGTNSNNDPSNLMSGYISNLRITKGTALYTTTFTPPTAPLTSVANTSLLACHANRFIDGSTNNFTVTRNGDARITAFGPFSTTVYSPAIHGGSAYFDGSGDYVTVADNPALDFGSGDFTMECWVYPTASGSLFSKRVNNATYAPYSTGFDSSMIPTLYCSTNGSTWGVNLISSVAGRFNSWNHIAYTRLGSTFTVWVNGVSGGTSTAIGASSLMTNSTAVSIAATAIDGATPMTGYLTGVRFIKGTALYTNAFTPPTAPVTATTNTSLLLNFTDAAILDSTGRNVIETVADAKTSSVITKFTGGSMLFDGTGDYLLLPDNNELYFGSGNFTAECWAYPTASPSQPIIMGQWSGSTGGTTLSWVIILSNNSSRFLRFALSTNGSGVLTDSISSSALTLNDWNHVALVRNGDVFTAYLNGTSVVTYTITAGTALYNATNPVSIGGSSAGSEPFQGYLQDLRITKYARYTSNFTPPTLSHRLK